MRTFFLVVGILPGLFVQRVAAAERTMKPVPWMQAVPEPYSQISFQRQGKEIARYHFGKELRRPFVFPLIGPSGRSLTRMGHPRDPESHSHHNSVWIAHHDVGGVSFWDDRGKGKIVHQRIESMDDSDAAAWVISINHWLDDGGNVLLAERRRTMVQTLDGEQWMLVIDLQLEARRSVSLGKTPFGLIGVRMAKTIGVHDGGGMIRNSVGQVNEKEVFWKPARWVDYSGPIADRAGEGVAAEGITLLDHPMNPGHPNAFHVRDDGWMGASLTLNGERKLEVGTVVALKYGMFVHAGRPAGEEIDRVWERFAKMELLAAPLEK